MHPKFEPDEPATTLAPESLTGRGTQGEGSNCSCVFSLYQGSRVLATKPPLTSTLAILISYERKTSSGSHAINVNRTMNSKVTRLFHPNGALRAEIPLQNGRPHGLRKDWHLNGTLAAEIPFENGLQHGVTKAWATDGRLLGEYVMEHGVGTFKSWYDNGVLSQEIEMRAGEPNGRQRSWDENGEFVGEAYWIKGKKLSRKKYIEASKSGL
jgi:antitoxin component YwqK of YwqJK toxin-antitoxin module